METSPGLASHAPILQAIRSPITPFNISTVLKMCVLKKAECVTFKYTQPTRVKVEVKKQLVNVREDRYTQRPRWCEHESQPPLWPFQL